MNELIIKNVKVRMRPDGTVELCLEHVARGLGFTRKASSGNEVIRWGRVRSYLIEFSVPTSGHGTKKAVGREGLPEFIPENIFYKMCFKASNDTARAFQDLVTDEVLPTIRKTGTYTAPNKTNAEKVKRGEVYEKCVNAQRARLYLEIAKQTDIKSYKDICLSYAAKELAGDLVLPLPKAEKRTFSATEIATICGVTANKIGCVANANNMKSPYSVKEVETFRYYENAIARFRELLYEPIRFI